LRSIVAHIYHGGGIEPALRADAKGHAIPAGRDHRYFCECDWHIVAIIMAFTGWGYWALVAKRS
jgi:hypothetical protein